MPKIEIPLNALELYCVKSLLKPSKSLPWLLSPSDVQSWARIEGIVPWHSIRALEIEELQERLTSWNQEFGGFLKIIRDNGISSENPNWEDNLKECFPDLYTVYLDFQRVDSEINMLMSEVCHKEFSWKKEKIRNLYGIIALVEKEILDKVERSDHYIPTQYTHGFIIPHENIMACRNSLRTSLFKKELEIDDLQMLHYLMKRTFEIKNGRINGRNPRFSIPMLTRELNIDRDQVRYRLENLGGLVGHIYGPECGVYSVQGIRKPVYWENWYIPHQRMQHVLELLS